MLFACAYLFIVIAVMVKFAIHPPTGWEGLWPRALTMPWSMFVFWDARGMSLVILLGFCALINASLFYVVGLTVSRLIDMIKGGAETPQD